MKSGLGPKPPCGLNPFLKKVHLLLLVAAFFPLCKLKQSNKQNVDLRHRSDKHSY